MRRILAGALVAVATTFALAAGAGADSHEDGEPTLAAEAELPAWDQEKVTELAEKLASSVRNLRRSARKQPPDTIASGQSASRMRLMDRLRLIERETRSLHDELSNGEGKFGFLLDEVEAVRKHSFTDRFFGILRDLYQRRSHFDGQLSIALAGSIDPQVLICRADKPYAKK